ncbi:hypothetical protein [Mucilaginibacter gossypiicola]|nr:hypothetical protein [Mucilaginibacter gossypiicola]
MNEAIIIGWPEEIEDLDAEDIIALDSETLRIKSIRTSSEGMMAALEWSLPTAYVVMLSGLFFKSFLEEAGKDAYQMLKTCIKNYILKKRQIKTRLLAASSSPKKLSPDYDQSLTITLKARLHSGLLVTVLVSEKVEQADADDMLEGMFHVLQLLYEDCQEKAPEPAPSNNVRPEEIYLLADPENKKWDIYTSKQLLEKYKS